MLDTCSTSAAVASLEAPRASPHAILPTVLLPACNGMQHGHDAHSVLRRYADAVRLAGALPLVVPRLEAHEMDSALSVAHGVLLTGSPSNVHPCHFDEDVYDDSLPLDPERDVWTLPLIREVLSRGMPLLAICRGTQEVNVALGGSLHQAVHEVPGHDDHRPARGLSVEERYNPAHRVDIVGGGVLEAIVGERSFQVNSVHGQGVKRLAAGLRIEAVAPDGVIEAFTRPSAPGFNLCLQWHPEWQAAHNPVSLRLLKAFGDAVTAYRDRARVPLPCAPHTA